MRIQEYFLELMPSQSLSSWEHHSWSDCVSFCTIPQKYLSQGAAGGWTHGCSVNKCRWPCKSMVSNAILKDDKGIVSRAARKATRSYISNESDFKDLSIRETHCSRGIRGN